MTPSWQLTRPYWELSGRSEGRPASVKRVTSIRRTVTPPPELIERASVEGASVLSMRFALYDTWTEIDSPTEGHFMEKIQRGAFAKSIKESLRNIKAVLSHGSDPSLGQTLLGRVDSIEEAPDAAIARVSLFPSVPALLLDGLRAQEYGSSFRGSAIKSHIERRPGRSAHNPQGLPEITRLEIRLKDIGPTPFPAYAQTTAQVETVADALVPARSRARAHSEFDRPSWSLADLHDPAWKLTNRRDERRRGRTYAKAAGGKAA